MEHQIQYRIPLSTYRLQFNQSLTFRDAAALVPYLCDLGITDCYASPYLRAMPGSPHGYDVVDPTMLNPELGSEADYQTFVQALQEYHMGQILDIVPNHMGIGGGWNLWWEDVLENGPCSHYSNFFDIDWHPVKQELENKVLLPILGDQYGIVLENQEIAVRYQEGKFFLQYYEHQLPLDPASCTRVLSYRLDELIEQEGEDASHIQELQSITTGLVNLPLRNEKDPYRIEERYREKDVIKRRLATLTQESPIVLNFLEENLTLFNGSKGVPHSFDLLDTLLSDQAYRLAYWRVASEEINYRRFFDINALAAIRMEHPSVFTEIHQKVFDLIKKGAVTGLRVDHVDGLFDPRTYLIQWQSWAQKELGHSQDLHGRSLFLIVEKILGKGETLSEDWPVHGTSGYEWLSLVNNLFIDPHQKRAFQDIYTRFSKNPISLEDLVYECKKLIMSSSMSSEINALAHTLNTLSERNRRARDFTLNNLIHAIREIIACFPVYRTYVTPNPKEEVTDRDRAYIRLATTKAKRKNPATNTLVFDFVRDLLLKGLDSTATLSWSEVHPFVMKFQQTTSPVTAKGVEDTAFYIHNRLTSLNEVGGEPSQFGITVSAFHERMRERQERWPFGLSTTSTHDTKRSEDVRARINVLSELPQEWKKHIAKWHKLNKKKKVTIDDQAVPDRNEEYLFYQTLVGAWPLETVNDQSYSDFRQRIQVYMNKALKEAKVHTSWINPHEPYEQAVHQFIEEVIDPNPDNVFLNDFVPFQRKIAYYGMYNALAQVILKITTPGVPDFYQGMELWDFSLVDPDNRRPVDFASRMQLLKDIQSINFSERSTVVQELLRSWQDGRIKMYVTTTLLQHRKAHPELFSYGEYIPLDPYGEKSDHICGFQRKYGRQSLMVTVPRFLSRLIQSPSSFPPASQLWGETVFTLVDNDAEAHYRDILTGNTVSPNKTGKQCTVSASELFQDLPFAILERMP